MHKNYEAIVLLTGGADSTTLLYYAKQKHKNILALHFETGLAANKFELKASKSISKRSNIDLRIIDLKKYIEMCNQFTPAVNESLSIKFGIGVIYSMTLAYALGNNIPNIYVAFHKEDSTVSVEYSQKFINYFEEGIKVVNANCKIVAPFYDWNKEQIITESSSNGAPLELSWSCINPKKNIQCGTCHACKTRRKAFKNAKLNDLTKYEI